MSDEVDLIYADPRQRNHALHLGMWIFLGSETLLFAGLFALYTGYRDAFPLEFRLGVRHNSVLIGTLNTAVLIISSFLVAFSIHALRGGRRRACMGSLAAAVVLGLAFLVFKSIEYTMHIHEGILPGPHYTYEGLPIRGAAMFFTLYYAMTGLHALHVIAGMVILTWLITRVKRSITTQHHHAELELGGLYWHLVDVVWIFLWPLLYLTHE